MARTIRQKSKVEANCATPLALSSPGPSAIRRETADHFFFFALACVPCTSRSNFGRMSAAKFLLLRSRLRPVNVASISRGPFEKIKLNEPRTLYRSSFFRFGRPAPENRANRADHSNKKVSRGWDACVFSLSFASWVENCRMSHAKSSFS